MSWGREWLSRALIALVLCLGISSVESELTVNNCPADITADRSNRVYWSPPTVSSNDSYTLVGSHQSGRFYYQNTTVNYTAGDPSDTKPCNFSIIVDDNDSPVITSCPADMTATAPAGATSVSVSWTAPTVEDSANVAVTPDKAPGSQFDLGRNTVLYTFSFTNDNSATRAYCSFDIFVDGGGSVSTPSLVCPDPIEVTLAVGQDSIPVTWDDPQYPSDLGSVTTVCARNKGDQFFEGRNEINCVGYFENGVARMCSFHVQVQANQDNQDPSILNCPSDMTVWIGPGETGSVVSWTEPTITDNNQQDLQLVSSHTNNIFYNNGTYDVVYTGTDIAGNEVQCGFRIEVKVDDLPPVFTNCPAPTLTAYVQAGESSGPVSWPPLEVNDESDDNVMLVADPTNTLTNGGPLNVDEMSVVRYDATDRFGNTQACQFTAILKVDQVPEYSGCSMDTTYATDQGVNYTNVTWPEPLVTDDFSEGRLILTKSYEPGMRFNIGVYVVKYTATDERQNVGLCSFVITVADEEDPVLGPCPASQTIVLGQSETSRDVTWTNPSATDNSGRPVTVTSSRNPGLFTEGTNPVTITAMDEAGNDDTCTFNIVVNPYVADTMDPVWTNCPTANVENTDSGQPTYEYTWTEPTVTDDRGVVSRFQSHSSPFAFPIGVTTVTYRAQDAAGNVGECTFDVTVTDNQAPVWNAGSGCGTSVTHYILSAGSLTPDLTVPTATDNSGVSPVITIAPGCPTSFSSSATAECQYTATDNAGNAVSNCPVRITVEVDTTPWNLRGSVTLTRIRGVASLTQAASATVLGEFAEDLDRLFRGSSIGSHFVGAQSISTTYGLNPRVTFRLYFNKMRQGRHTSRQISQAFSDAIGSSMRFATNNFVLSGSLDFHVREFKLTSTIIQIDNTANPAFLTDYNNPDSVVYMNLENSINDGMDSTYNGFFGYQVSVLSDLRDGSIINDEILVFDDSSQTTEAGIVNQFNNALDNTGELPGTGSQGLHFSAIPEDQNQEICPTNECQNGGTCSYNDAYTNMCTCADGFSGTNCENGGAINLSPLALAGIIGSSILLLLAIFALFCCCIYFCREPLGPYKDPRYLERPFQIVDDEESVVSSVDVFMMPRERMYRDPVPLPPPAPLLALEPAPPPEAPTLRLDDNYYPEDELFGEYGQYGVYGRNNDAFAMDVYPSAMDRYPSAIERYPSAIDRYPSAIDRYPTDAPTFSPDGEVYVTGPNQVAIRPSTKRSQYYRY